jgi:hypothetical protein
MARTETFAMVESRGHTPPAGKDGAQRLARSGSRGTADFLPRDAGLGGEPGHPGAHVHDVHRTRGIGVAVALLMGAVEGGDKAFHVPERAVYSPCGNGQFVTLPRIAAIEHALDAHPAAAAESFTGQFAASFALDGGECAGEPASGVRRPRGELYGAHILLHHVRAENPQSGEPAGQARHQHLRQSQRGGQVASVQSTRAPEGDQSKIAGVVTPLDGNHADGFFHGGVGYVHDALGQIFQGAQPHAHGARRACSQQFQ